MSSSRQGRRSPPVVNVLLGVLLVATLLYVVPTLALNGQVLAAVIAACVWLAAPIIGWTLYRRHQRRTRETLERERSRGAFYRRVVEHASEAHVVVGPDGEIRFASPGLERLMAGDPDHLGENGGLLDLVDREDRRRVLQEFARVRRQPGASVAVEVSATMPDASHRYLALHATNLVDDPSVSGVLVGVRDITPRKTLESEIQHLAYFDVLTGLSNRRFFLEQGRNALAMARRREQAAAVLYVDLDHFKQVNDDLGHEQGDALLQKVSAGIQKTLRDTDVMARLGGDEFAILLSEVRDEDAAGRVAHRLMENLPVSAMGTDSEVAVGASIGIAMFPEDGEDVEGLLRAADLAMYRAKTEELGVQFYRPELRAPLADQLRLEQDMRRAIEHHELYLHYQPVFQLASGRMVGAEALSRWRHVARGTVAARDFIKLAERSGLIRSLDRWALACGIQQRKEQAGGDWHGWVAVNLSPHSLSDPDLPAYVRELMEEAELEPGSLVLEMPESAVLKDTVAAADLMWELRNAGAAIALDDYGIGATSYAQLKSLPIDILKLHPDLIRGIGRDGDDEHLVEATMSLAHGIRAKVLAKGVERDAQVDWLRDVGCDFVQGYLVGLPVPVEELGREQPQPDTSVAMSGDGA